MLTQPGGHVVGSLRTLDALFAIRKDKLLPLLYGQVVITKSDLTKLSEDFASLREATPDWLVIADDPHDDTESLLPERVVSMYPRDGDSERAIRLGLSIGASMILLDGPVKEKAKLSFIKSEGALPILVMAYRLGHLSAVKPMVKALTAMGRGEVLPDDEQLQALWTALDQLG